MSDSFSVQSAAILFILSALLLPMILLTQNIFLAGFYILLFIIAQVALLYYFHHEIYGFMAWYSFIAAVTGLLFILVVVLLGRGLQIELLGFLLFLGYFIGGVVFLLHKAGTAGKPEDERKKTYREFYDLDDEDIADFRKKDDLGKLVHEFSIQPAPKKDEPDLSENYDFDEIFASKRPAAFTGDLAESTEDESWSGDKEEADEQQQKADSSGSWVGAKDDEGEDYKVQLLRQRIEEERKPDEHPDNMPKEYPRFSDYFKTQHTYHESEAAPYEEPKKESPQVSFDQVKTHLETIDSGVKKISDKIREIGEKAIKEGEEKKKKAVAAATEKKIKPTEVYASNNGTKYHHDRACASLKRVSKRNIVTFKDHNEARKRGLKACGLCKK